LKRTSGLRAADEGVIEMSEPSILAKVLANLTSSKTSQTGAGDAARPFTREQDLLAKGNEIAERLDRLQGKLDEASEDETDLPIRERFYRQLKNSAKN
jgi:hypothetical protein